MTHDESVGQLLDAWLGEGPLQAPQGLAAGTSGRIQRQRQRPGWLVGRVPEREPMLMAAASVAAIVVVGLALTLVLRPPRVPDVAAPPTPRPSVPVSMSPAAALRPPINPDRQPCLEGYAGCLGPMAAGRHTAAAFGAAFDVPRGWTNAVDTPDWMLLGPIDAPALSLVAVLRGAVVSGQDAACTPQPRPELGNSVDAIVAHITHRPGLITSEPIPVTIGGLAGRRVDVALDRAWTQTCPFNGQPTVMYLTQDRAAPGWFWVTDPSEHQRVTVLDDRAGGVIVVVVNAPSADAFRSLVDTSDPIVASLDFEPGDPQGATPGPTR